MKIKTMALATILFGATLTACQNHQERAELKTSTDSLFYAIGYKNGSAIREQLKNQIENSDSILKDNKELDILIAGYINGVKGDEKNSQINSDQAQEIISNYFRELEIKKKLAEDDAYMKIKAQNEAYMAERAKEEGMVALPKLGDYTGPAVLVKKLQETKGDTIGEEDHVYLTYDYKLADGQIVKATDGAVMAPMKGMIKGLHQALLTMRAGESATIVVPSELGFGRESMNGIPANSNLIYDVTVERVFHSRKEAELFMKAQKEKQAAIAGYKKDSAAKAAATPAAPAAPAKATTPAAPAKPTTPVKTK